VRLARRILNASWSFGGGQGFTQPDFWTSDAPIWRQSWRPDHERIGEDFVSYVTNGIKANGVVFACMLARQLVFSEVRFAFQRSNDGRPGKLFGGPGLEILERPGRNQTTGELLARMEQDTTGAGNWIGTVRQTNGRRRVRRLRPDWCTILTGSPSDDPFDVDAEPIGLIYDPKPYRSTKAEPLLLSAEQYAHWSPIPDPLAQWRGMSWMTPVVREIMGDSAATDHKLAFFKRGAAPGLAISYDKELGLEDFKAYVKAFEAEHAGVTNAWKTLHIGHAANVTPLTADLKGLDFKNVMASAETRIAAASGVGAVVAQLSEGLQGSSLNAGNFAVARKRSETMLFRPLWRSASATLEGLIELPPEALRLTYDPGDVAFLREDAKDEAEIRKTDAETIDALVRSGWDPDSIKEFMATDGDYSVLEHMGLPSVQVQPSAPAPAE